MTDTTQWQLRDIHAWGKDLGYTLWPPWVNDVIITQGYSPRYVKLPLHLESCLHLSRIVKRCSLGYRWKKVEEYLRYDTCSVTGWMHRASGLLYAQCCVLENRSLTGSSEVCAWISLEYILALDVMHGYTYKKETSIDTTDLRQTQWCVVLSNTQKSRSNLDLRTTVRCRFEGRIS